MAALSPEADPDRANEQKNESTSPACCHAHVKYSFGQGELKGEVRWVKTPAFWVHIRIFRWLYFEESS